MGSEPKDSREAGVPKGRGVAPPDDRYGRLMEGLRSGERGPEGGSRHAAVAPPPIDRPPAAGRGWHPVVRTLLVVTVTLAIAYVGLVLGNELLRRGRVDTWAGPDATVRSGNALEGCSEIEGAGDDAFPAWVRYRSVIYASSERISPVGTGWQYGATPYTESEYRLGSIRLLLGELSDGEATPRTVFLLQEPAQAARVYDRTACA